MSLVQVNLKDPKYLMEYEACIHKLPLDELYEVLDIIKKDDSPERIQIVTSRIQEIDDDWHEPRWISKVGKTQFPKFDKAEIKKIKPEEDPYKDLGSAYRKISSEELDDIHRTVDEVFEKYKNNPPSMYLRMRSSGPYFSSDPQKTSNNTLLFEFLFGIVFFSGLIFCIVKEILL